MFSLREEIRRGEGKLCFSDLKFKLTGNNLRILPVGRIKHPNSESAVKKNVSFGTICPPSCGTKALKLRKILR